MRTRPRIKMPICDSTDRELKQYLCSVLNPVENATLWKEIKARAAAPAPKHRREENIELEEEPQIHFSSNCLTYYNQSKPPLQDIAVDASLRNWLISPNTDESKARGSTKSCNIAFDALSSKKNICDGSFSCRSREDRIILDITNMEVL
ncbi:hypothetical protein PTKIN_Ptkin10aG0033800 [Pterospermum kingtungense]